MMGAGRARSAALAAVTDGRLLHKMLATTLRIAARGDRALWDIGQPPSGTSVVFGVCLHALRIVLRHCRSVTADLQLLFVR